LDCVRANKFVGQAAGKDPASVAIPVIGGHAGATIMPVFSQDPAGASIPKDAIEALDKRVQDAGTEVVNAKNGKGSATLSMAYAGARMGRAVLAGLAGGTVTECAYVASNVSELPYFTSKVVFGKSGVQQVLPVGALNDYEKKRLAEATAQLKGEIQTGLDYAAKNSLASSGNDNKPGMLKVPSALQAPAPLAPNTGNGAFKVCVCGGAGGIGQPLSMLMAMNSNVRELCVFDLNIAMVPAAGVAADLGHVERKSAVKGYEMVVGGKPIDNLKECLTGCDVVLVPAGLPRKPGMTRDDLMKVNGDIAKGIVEACAAYCPNAILLLIVNPVNSVVPAMAELYKKKGLDHKKIVGVTTLDCVRANKFVAQITGKDPTTIEVPVIGGHAGATIMPVFSQDPTAASIPAAKIEALDKRVQDAGTEVVMAKNGKGSATLSMAYSGARMASAVLKGLAGTPTTECAYVASNISELPYFTSKVTFGRSGVQSVLPIGTLNDYEKKRLAEATAQLKGEIQTGLDYAAKNQLGI